MLRLQSDSLSRCAKVFTGETPEGQPMDSLDNIVEKLTSIAEELNDVAMGILSDAISEGKTDRPPLEKKVSQARRTVEKAIHQLTGVTED